MNYSTSSSGYLQTRFNKFFVICRDYFKAYAKEHTCKDVDEAVKIYKSHRRVFSINSYIYIFCLCFCSLVIILFGGFEKKPVELGGVD